MEGRGDGSVDAVRCRETRGGCRLNIPKYVYVDVLRAILYRIVRVIQESRPYLTRNAACGIRSIQQPRPAWVKFLWPTSCTIIGWTWSGCCLLNETRKEHHDRFFKEPSLFVSGGKYVEYVPLEPATSSDSARLLFVISKYPNNEHLSCIVRAHCSSVIMIASRQNTATTGRRQRGVQPEGAHGDFLLKYSVSTHVFFGVLLLVLS